jgi:hypothetical protein
MFQSIRVRAELEYIVGLTKADNSYQVIDSEFAGDIYKISAEDCAFQRIIIHEYGKRQLNVAANLKLYYDTQFVHHDSYKYAIGILSVHRNILNAYYSHLNFDEYYECLKRHLYRMACVGKLKY